MHQLHLKISQNHLISTSHYSLSMSISYHVLLCPAQLGLLVTLPFLCSKGRQIPTICGGTGTDQRIVGHFIGFQGVPGAGDYWQTRKAENA